MIYNIEDTITGIATAVSNSGVSIIRISGKESIQILSKIFRCKNNVLELKSHSITYGFLYDDNVLVDEVLVSIMKAPKSYTTEDVVEINCHGGVIVTKKVLNLVIKNGARLSNSGEFTKRAFLNGRIDLLNAESISALIMAKTEREEQVALSQLTGSLSKEIKSYREEIIILIATSEASIDYPEHDMEHSNIKNIEVKTMIVLEKLKYLKNTAKNGRIIKNGIDTVILGRPNVGKSSLLNKLVGQDVAIVTDTPGTTRDTITEFIDINGIMLKVMDTAGIRDTEDKIEKIGIEKAREKALNSELVLFLLDGSSSTTSYDIELLNTISDKKIIVIVNKTDLEQKADIALIENIVPKGNICYTSIANEDIDGLYKIIDQMFLDGTIDNESNNLIINTRHENLIISAIQSLTMVLDGISMGMSEDLLVIDLIDAYTSLGYIIGESIDEDIVDKIFSEFCLGK